MPENLALSMMNACFMYSEINHPVVLANQFTLRFKQAS